MRAGRGRPLVARRRHAFVPLPGSTPAVERCAVPGCRAELQLVIRGERLVRVYRVDDRSPWRTTWVPCAALPVPA